MGLKLQLDPTPTRVYIIALLIFFEALLIPIQGYLINYEQFPSEVLIITWILTAAIQLITFAFAFLGYEKE